MTKYKLGDTYVDGEYTYKVIKVYENGTCEAQRVDKITSSNVKNESAPVKEMAQPSRLEDVPEKITEESVNYSKTQINRMPNAELEKLCKKFGIEVGTGTEMKRALIAKLGL